MERLPARLLFMGCLVLNLIALSGCDLNSSAPGVTGAITVVPTPATIPVARTPTIMVGPNAEDIPLYPNAAQVTTTVEIGPWIRTTEYVSSTPATEIRTFYKDMLTKNGWLVQTNYPYTPNVDIPNLAFTWSDNTGAAPWRLYLDLSFGKSGEGDVSVKLYLRRWPDVTKMPLYADAQQVTVSAGDPPWVVSGRRITTYITHAGPHEVMAYYRDIMQQYGWSLGDGLGDSLIPPLTFRYRIGGPEDEVAASASIDAEAQPDGLTQVRIVTLEE